MHDPDGRRGKDSRPENRETSITHGIYVVVGLAVFALALWAVIELFG